MQIENKNIIKNINHLFAKILLEIKKIFEFELDLNSLLSLSPSDLKLLNEWSNILINSNHLFRSQVYKKVICFIRQENLLNHIKNSIVNNSNLFNLIEETNLKIKILKQIISENLFYEEYDIVQRPMVFSANSTNNTQKNDQYKNNKLEFIQNLDNLTLMLQELNTNLSNSCDSISNNTSYITPKKLE